MPRTIDEGFRDFLTTLTPWETESEKAKSHRASIEGCLKANFTLKRFFRTGSFGNGTSIAGYSDVDYFACVPANELKENSSSTLREFREKLEARFPNTGVAVKCPAISIPFGLNRNEYTEVVPADFVKDDSGFAVFDIPNCASGGWMRSSPDAHNAYVRYVNEKLSGKVKPLIRFVKAWKYRRQVPISSFYLELRVANYAAGEKSIVYDIDVKNFFVHLSQISLAQLQDPMGISGYINPCISDAQLEEASSKLETAVVRAEKARAAEERGDTKSAFEWWSLLYDGGFPGYYR